MTGSSRRRFLAAGLSVAGVTAGCATLRDVSPYHATIDSVDGTWPMHGHDPGNSNFAPATHPPAGRVTQAWASSLDQDLSTGPAVGDGAVFVRATEMLYALEGTSGDVRWRQQIGAGVFQTPTVDGGTVYVATRGGIGALEADSGAVRWGAGISDRLFMRPVVVGDTVFAMDGGGTAAALSRDDGAVRWRTATTDAGLSRPATTFVVGESELLQVGSGGSLYALATEDGSVDWRQDLPESETATLLVAEDTVIVGQRRSVHAFDVTTGTRRWQVDLDDQVQSVCSDGASLYVTSVRDPEASDTGGVVRCLDLPDGVERWTLEGGDEFGAPTPAGAGDTLYVLGQHRDGNRRLLSIDTDSGTKRWSRTFDTSLDYDIAVVDGALFLSEHGSGVRAFGTPG